MREDSPLIPGPDEARELPAPKLPATIPSGVGYLREIVRRSFVCLTFLLLLAAGSLTAQQRVMPPLNRAKLPEAARNLQLERLSS